MSSIQDTTRSKLIENTLVFLAQGVASNSGEDFFAAVAKRLGETLGMDYVCIDRLEGDLLAARTLAVYFEGRFEDNVTYALKDTPCGEVVKSNICCYPNGVRHLFPNDLVLQQMQAESYLGTVLFDSKKAPIGLIAVIGRKPLDDQRLAQSIIEIVGIRVAGELERKQAEEALGRSEGKYRSLFENMVEIAHIWKLVRNDSGQIETWRLVDANPPALRHWGMSLENVVGKTADEIYAGSTARYFEHVQRTMTEGIPSSFNEYNPPLDKFFSFTSVPFGEHFITTGADITGIRKSEEALRASESKYRSLFKNMLEGCAYCRMLFDEQNRSMDFVYLAVNDAFGKLTGLDNVAGRRATEVIPGIKEMNPELFEIYGRVASTGNPEQFEIYFRPLSLYLSVSVYCPEKAHFVAVFHDITESKKIEDERKRSRIELEERVQERTRELAQTASTLADEVAKRISAEQDLRERSDQLRALASELTLAEQRERMRLAQILHDGLQQILVAAKYRVATAERSQHLKASIDEITELLDDAIETSRSLTAELSPPILREGGLVPAIEWLVRWMREKHSLDVRLTVRDNIEPPSQDIVLLLFQATRELLFNVVKHAFTKAANLEVAQRDGRIQVTVEDRGIGFDTAEIPAKRGNSGGFGLFSIRERISLFGGQMEINSTPGQGSRFELAVPFEAGIIGSHRSSDSDASPVVLLRRQIKASGAPDAVRIVLVDDHIIVRQGLAGLLSEEPDFEIVGEASDGESAVNLVRELRPDVVLMDISMPGMNGIEATRIIHREFPDIHIIGLSMYMEGDQAAAMREAGAANYLTKSRPGNELIKAIRTSVRVFR